MQLICPSLSCDIVVVVNVHYTMSLVILLVTCHLCHLCRFWFCSYDIAAESTLILWRLKLDAVHAIHYIDYAHYSKVHTI